MNPAGNQDEAGAIMALAEARIEALGPKRFGAEDHRHRSTWWEIYFLAEAGYSRAQIIAVIDEHAAERREWLREPDMFDVEKVQAQIDLWVEVKAAISAITA